MEHDSALAEIHPEELEALVDFLRDCPGRLSAAVVPDQEAGSVLLERLRGALPELAFELIDDSRTPGEIGYRAYELGQSEGNVLVVRLDRSRPLDPERRAIAFWHWLNHQRERLASGSVRTFLLLDEAANDRLAVLADDLCDWVSFFRFPPPDL